MSIRIPDEIHAKAAALAAAEHVSINSVIVQATERYVNDRARERVVNAAVERVFAENAELFRRLADT
ncbi:YlcI/YnfO family protein [Actinocorallia aurea]